MTITAPDFEQAIDAAPRGDPDVRHAYADWLEESGDSAGARFQRWMGEHRRAVWESVMPQRDGSVTWFSGIRIPSMHHEKSNAAIIPSSVYEKIDGYYPTRIEAEQALRTALEAVDYEVTW